MILADTSVLIARNVSWPDAPAAASAISLGELQFGVEVARTPADRNFRLRRIQRYSALLEWIPFEEPDARSYGILAAKVAKQRPAHARSKDIVIAAQALTLGVPLLTLNVRDFDLVRDLVEIVDGNSPVNAE